MSDDAQGLQSSGDAPTSYPGDVPSDQPPPDDFGVISPHDQAVSGAQSAVVWDALGVIPGIGTASSVVATGIDVVKAGVTGALGDTDDAKRYLQDASLDAMGTIPIAGQLLSGEALLVDGHALASRSAGTSAEDAPTFGDMYAQGQSGIVDQFLDPDSFTPRGPAEN